MIQKNYRLIRFMNKDRSFLFRFALGATAWLGSIVATGSSALAYQSWKDFMNGEIKAGFRRCGWYSRKSWLNLKFVDDRFFIFSEGVGDITLNDLQCFVERNKSKHGQLEYLTDMLLIFAQRLHLKINKEESRSEIDDAIDKFYSVCNDILEILSKKPVVKENPPINSDNARVGDFSRTDAVVALEDFADVLPLQSWPWFVESGTFLGLHREGGFLAHDYDIDLGIDYNSCDLKSLISCFDKASSFVIKKLDHHIQIYRNDEGAYDIKKLPALVKLVHKSGINVDIFIHHSYGGFSWHGSSIHWWKNKQFDLELRSLEGVDVFAPKQADQYLTENYGDWKTPVTDFDCTSGTPNLSIAKNFLSIALFMKRLAIFSMESPDEAFKVKKALLDSEVLEDRNGRLLMKEYI
ncbi:MAG: hypothetical protein ACQEUY_16590 [Pseudomonadota bacterium]